MNSITQPNNPPQSQDDDEGINVAEYFDIAYDNRWVILLLTAVFLLCGFLYATLLKPVYESNLSVQVEDSEKSANSFLGDAGASLFNVKTPAAGEIEIIKSRMILSQVVENIKLYISAYPRYAPLVGNWMSRHANELSKPSFLGMSGYVTGAERITVPQFDVPRSLEGALFLLTAETNGEFNISFKGGGAKGYVGTPLDIRTPDGVIHLLVSDLEGAAGAQFELRSNSKLAVLNSLQSRLKVAEKGKQSGVIDVTLESTDRNQLVLILNEIGRLYVRQNIDRKAAEAEKTLGFLDNELPKFKRQLELSEDAYNKFRNQNGTVSLDDEAKGALAQNIELQGRLIDAQQKRRELSAKFTDRHPSILTLDSQISAIQAALGSVDQKIRNLPMVQQNALRMERDIKVNTDLYVSLLNSSLQMRLAKEGKVGNVRLLDSAVVPNEPIKPQKSMVIFFAFVFGLLMGVAAAIVKNKFFGGVRNPAEIEAYIGLPVYSTVPLSAAQAILDREASDRAPGVHVLLIGHPEDAAIESLRSLRTALQFAMLEAPNNRLLISGGTPGVGKSFISVNFAAIVAASGKRVLLIDADLRKGHINQVFSKQRAGGLSELIAGTKTFADTVHRTILANLDFVTTGVLPPNPAELLMSDSFASLLDDISKDYDLVVIDTAPVLVASDTSAVAPLAGTRLLVARAERTHLGELAESVKRLNQVGCAVNGIILNAMDLSKRHYGSYGYKYGGYRYTQYKYNQI